MQKANRRVQQVRERLTTLSDLLSKLSKTILDREARAFLLRPPTNSLRDVERHLLPKGAKAETAANAVLWLDAAEFQLQSAGAQLNHVQDLISKYGPNLRVVGR